MPLMTASEKREALAAFQAHPHTEGVAVLKQQVRDAIDAVDAYMDTIAPTIRTQIEPTTRALLTPAQTRVLIRSIMQARYS